MNGTAARAQLARFLRDLLKIKADERTVRLIPVALVILRQYGDSNRTAERMVRSCGVGNAWRHGRYNRRLLISR